MIERFTVFDLDSTLAEIDHRLKHLHTRDDGAKGLFNVLCVNDTPIEHTCNLFRLLLGSSQNVDGGVRIWTGRTEAVRSQTLDWLSRHVSPTFVQLANMLPYLLMMRPVGDFRPDNELKLGWLNMLSPAERAGLAAAFDDRDRVVKMYRDNGVLCYQVANGNF